MLGAIIGSAIGAGASLWGNSQNIKNQREFAQKGIRWKVADSLKAGIHPLFGLGANTMSFSPTNVGGELSQVFSNMGQDIDRSRMATSDASSRGVLGKLALERAGLENDLLRAQIASTVRRVSAPHVPPGLVLAPRTNQPMNENPSWVVGNPELGQRAEDAYGELGGGLIGLLGLGRDTLVNVRNRYYKPGPSRPVVRPSRGGYPRYGGY